MTLRCGGQPRPALPKKIKKEVLEELTEKTMLKPKEINALYRRFRLLARESGYLFPEQFRQTMGVLGLTDDPFLPDRMFLVFDIDQDGKLSFFEFASSLAVMIRGTEDEKLKLSFEMTAGRRGAPSISFKDFQQLIRACSTMMQSLVTPDALPVDDMTIRRMFRDLSSDESNDEDAVITMEDYKAAARAMMISWSASDFRLHL
jgi:Ca2+-binding EF-hand superfamily protein